MSSKWIGCSSQSFRVFERCSSGRNVDSFWSLLSLVSSAKVVLVIACCLLLGWFFSFVRILA